MRLSEINLAMFTASFVFSQTTACVKYKEYLEDLDYCADPLYWSNYKITQTSYKNIETYETNALSDYKTILNATWYNTELLDDTGIKRSKLTDCIGIAQRIACHTNIPRCADTDTDRGICKGLCERFHDRCTINGVNYIQRGLGSSYTYYTCDGLPDHDCSPASRSASLVSFAVFGIIALLSSFLMI